MVYISSCEEYYSQKGFGKIDDIEISLILPGSHDELTEELRFCYSTKDDTQRFAHDIYKIKECCKDTYFYKGYYKHYLKPFQIVFIGEFSHFLSEEDLLQIERDARLNEEAYIREMNNTPPNFLELEAQGIDWRTGNYFYSEHEEEKEKEEELTINDFRTFKIEQCVICLDNTPNVLFCNCGHLCVCKTCIMNFTNCPVCKKESTILRIIE